MKRPIYVFTIGFIFGIIGGLLFKEFPFFILLILLVILLFTLLDIRSKNNFLKILRVFIRNNTLILFLISTLISSIYLEYLDNKYSNFYNNFSESEIVATVISDEKEGDYTYTYVIKLDKGNNIKLNLSISKSYNLKLEYGDKIKVKGEYNVPNEARNFGGFNYKNYLKTKGIYGIFRGSKINIISKNNVNILQLLSHNLKAQIINNIEKVLPEKTNGVFLEMLVGYKENLQEDVQESFRNSSLSHLLVISGMHVTYLILGLTYLFFIIKVPKKINNFIINIFLIFFMCIVDFSPSIIRACVMEIFILSSIIICRRVDTKTSISTSALIILIINPYKVCDISFELSYVATISILMYNNIYKRYFYKKECLNKVYQYIKEIILISIFVNIFIAPIIIYNFNMLSFSFLISNIVVSILIIPIIIGGLILIILSFLNGNIITIIAKVYNLLLLLLIKITEVIGKCKFFQVIYKTPNVIFVILYYIIIFIITYVIYLKRNYKNRYIIKKILYSVKKIFIKKNIYKFIIIFLILLTIFSIRNIIPKDFRLYFVDVGQGDCSLLITPTNKKIIIDSGGSESGSYDVGKSVLVPYLLDRRIKKVDYIIISHFDTDHCDGFKYVLENIKVSNVVISKQYEETENFKEIYEIINSKKINLIIVTQGNVLKFDKYTNAKILNPSSKLSEDINDNSIVMKVTCFNKSCLFTGDISQEKEKELIKEYGNEIESDILKVAHHGSKNSSCQEFLKYVNPKISLIGVGENNKFGHPSEEVIERLKNIKSEIYRTDKNGEIEINISMNEKIKLATKNSCNK